MGVHLLHRSLGPLDRAQLIEDIVELILNLVWLAVAVAALAAWFRWRAKSSKNTGQQLVLLALAAAILFPVISMTDDLWAAQNPAEPESYQKRHIVTAEAHWPVPAAITIIGKPASSAPPHQSRRALEPDSHDLPTQILVDCSVFTRPPPEA